MHSTNRTGLDPTNPTKYPPARVFGKLEALCGRRWKHKLGDGKASERIYKDVVSRLLAGRVPNHRPKDYHLDIRRSYREDGVSFQKLNRRRGPRG